jgi:hypothetical protein
MLHLQRIAKLHADVVDASLDEGETALLHLGTKTYFSLNRTGSRIWELLKDGLSLEDVSRRIHDEFEVELDDARGSVLQLVDALAHQDLVSISGDSGDLPR